MLGVGLVAERVEQSIVGAGAGGVVLPAGPDRGGPQGPAVRTGHDLDVPAVMVVLARPPQVHPQGGPVAFERSVRIRVPSMFTCVCPAIRAASSAPRSDGAAPASTSMASRKYR
jgi:hypothetical protein